MAQRRVRACLLAVIPKDVQDAAEEQASVTLKTKADTSPEAMAKMIDAFAPFGVTKEHIEKRIQRRLDSISPAQVVQLKRIYASLRDEMSTAGEWFDIEAGATDGDGKVTTLKDIAAKADKKKPPTGPNYATLADRMTHAADKAIADLVLQDALTLPQDQYAGIEALHRERFPA